LYRKTSSDALAVRYWLRSFDRTSHKMKRHVQHRLIMPQMLTAWGWNLELQESKLVCVIHHHSAGDMDDCT